MYACGTRLSVHAFVCCGYHLMYWITLCCSRSPTPEVGSPVSPVVNPPMNSRRTVLLEGTDKGYGFRLEVCL